MHFSIDVQKHFLNTLKKRLHFMYHSEKKLLDPKVDLSFVSKVMNCKVGKLCVNIQKEKICTARNVAP